MGRPTRWHFTLIAKHEELWISFFIFRVFFVSPNSLGQFLMESFPQTGLSNQAAGNKKCSVHKED